MPLDQNRKAFGVWGFHHRSCYWIVVALVLLCRFSTVWIACAGGGVDNPHKVLGVSRRASFKEIQRCYRKLCLEYHPDKNVQKSKKERSVAEAKFKLVREAYDAIQSKRLNRRTLISDQRENFVRTLRHIFVVMSRPGLVITELRRANLFAMGTPVAKRCPRIPSDPDVKSEFVQSVQVPLKDLYTGVPNFRLKLQDTLFARYKASIRGRYIFYSLHQASSFFFPLLRHDKVLASLIGFYIVHGTTPIPNPNATYTTKIKRGAKGGKTTIRFGMFRQLELIFHIQEAPHPIYHRVGNNLHAELNLSIHEAENGCTKQLQPLDPSEKAIEIQIPAKEYSHEKEQQLYQSQDKNQTCNYENSIRIRGRGWPIRNASSKRNHPNEYRHGDLIVSIRVQKSTPD